MELLQQLSSCHEALAQRDKKARPPRQEPEGAVPAHTEWNGIVPADTARAHLLDLGKAGVVLRIIAEVTKVSPSTLTEIRTGDKLKIRASTEKLILAITPDLAAERGFVDAQASWALIDQLASNGVPDEQIKEELGECATMLLEERSRQITIRCAQRVREVHAGLMDGSEVIVSSALSLRLISELRTEYYKDGPIARELGIEQEKLVSIGRHVSADFERRLRCVYDRLMN